MSLDLGEPTGRDIGADATLLRRYEARGMTPEEGEMFLMCLPDHSYWQLVQSVARMQRAAGRPVEPWHDR